MSKKHMEHMRIWISYESYTIFKYHGKRLKEVLGENILFS